jgi:hypothetical protein
MKLSITLAFALAALVGGPLSAQACNPALGPNYGKHVSATILPAAMLAENAGVGSPRSIVGLWHDIHTASDGTLFLEGYDTWVGSGTEYELGNLPPAGGNLCVGVWKTYGDTVELTAHVAWVYDLNNNYVGTLDFTEKNKVSANGKIYRGTFDARFFNTTGGLIQEIKGTTVAERLGK